MGMAGELTKVKNLHLIFLLSSLTPLWQYPIGLPCTILESIQSASGDDFPLGRGSDYRPRSKEWYSHMCRLHWQRRPGLSHSIYGIRNVWVSIERHLGLIPGLLKGRMCLSSGSGSRCSGVAYNCMLSSVYRLNSAVTAALSHMLNSGNVARAWKLNMDSDSCGGMWDVSHSTGTSVPDSAENREGSLRLDEVI